MNAELLLKYAPILFIYKYGWRHNQRVNCSKNSCDCL